MADIGRLQASISTIEVTVSKIEEAIEDLKKDSCPGIDDMPPIFLKRCATSIGPVLARIMSKSMPREWKQAIVIPIYKKGDKHNPLNYRPVSLTSCVCKVMEKIITREVIEFMAEHNIIPKNQHGFMPRRSVSTNLLTTINWWMNSLDNDQPVDVIYLDYEKEFDNVPHGRLLAKLEHIGIRGDLLLWIGSFLAGREFGARLGGQLSRFYPVFSGVPQGSVLGPLLFLLYTSDLVHVVSSNIVMYADDTKIYGHPSPTLQEDLRKVLIWSKEWLLPLNIDKCTVLHMGRNNPRNQYTMEQNALKAVKTQEHLGILMTEDLKWAPHINRVVKRANILIYLFQRAFEDRSVEMVSTIYKT